MPLLLKNATYINPATLLFSQTDILVSELKESLEFPEGTSTIPGVEVLDCRGMLVTRALGCGHHHAYSALARGMPPPVQTPSNFEEVLRYIWWKLDKSLDPALIEASALVTAMDCARNGVTAVIDHHASPFSIDESLDILAEAFERVGIQHLLCYEISDRDGIDRAMKGIGVTDTYLSKKQGLVGLHASFTVSEETLLEAAHLARTHQTGLHLHVAEDPVDQAHCQSTYGKRVVRRLADAGVLESPRTVLAHCLHLDETERRLISESPAWVVQNPESNLNNKVGTFRSLGLGPRIMIGTDGMHSDMIRSTRAACLTGIPDEHPGPAGSYHRLRNVDQYFHSNGFKGLEDNNLIVLDYDSPTPLHQDNFCGHLIYGLENRHIRHVIAAGRLIVRDGMVVTVNQTEILNRARDLSRGLWEKMKQTGA